MDIGRENASFYDAHWSLNLIKIALTLKRKSIVSHISANIDTSIGKDNSLIN